MFLFIEQDVRKRWKSVRDRFLRQYRELPASGSSPSQRNKICYIDDMLFILPQRGLRPSSGNFESCQAQDDQDGQQLRESESSPCTSPAGNEEAAGDEEQQAEPSGGGQHL